MDVSRLVITADNANIADLAKQETGQKAGSDDEF